MSQTESPITPQTFEEIAEAVCLRLAKNQRVRRNLPGEGRLRMDRQLPFLCVYRKPPNEQDAGTWELVTTEAAYLFASGAEEYHQGLNHLCQRVNAAMQEHFGVFLLIEIWAETEGLADEAPPMQAAFRVESPDLKSLPSAIEVLKSALSKIQVHGQKAQVTLEDCEQVQPPGLLPLDPVCNAGQPGSVSLGLAVRPIYRDAQTGDLYPLILQSLRSQLADALRQGIAEFSSGDSTADPAHYHSYGPTALVKSARIVDQQLAEISESYDFLLQVTPTNSDEAWKTFKKNQYKIPPQFQYRPLSYHPNLLKRRLFAIEIDRIEDPTLAHLCREKQDEVDIQLTALKHLDTPKFLYCSLLQYGAPDDKLVALAKKILKRYPKPEGGPSAGGKAFDTEEVVRRAREEIDYYRQQMNEFQAKVEICNHISSGIMVSKDRLLVSETLRLSRRRIEPLFHHEIGTHLLTYFNGRRQPFQQLYAGLADYDELQEGLALLAEYLTGGLTINRLRKLAARVMASHSMINQEPFVETFRLLQKKYHFPRRQSFVTTLRAYRGGGFTKDIIYLRGFRDLLEYLSAGHDVEPLYVGKIGLKHLPFIQEMRRRGIIHPPALLPRFWNDETIQRRIDTCRNRSVLDLLEDNR